MKTIGLIGGMSWESSLEYYRIINEEVKKRLGGLHSAECIMYSVDFEEIEKFQSAGDWERAGAALAKTARSLEKGGADFILLCTNTMHKVSDSITAAVDIPMLHIAEATAEAVTARGIKKIGLLGTKYTMEQDFYKGVLSEKFGLEVLVPEQEDRDLVNQVIFEELVLGKIREESREKYKAIIKKLVADGAEGVILGCTEIGLLVKPEDSEVPLFDTTYIHAEAAVERALKG